MNKNSPNFKSGKIEEVTSTDGFVKMKMLNANVESGELVLEIHPHADGHLHLHFSGLGSKVINTVSVSGNGLDIVIIP